MKTEEPLVIGYSRDSKGKIVGRHLKAISNTLHVANFSTTSQYLLEPTVLRMERTEEEKVRRKAHGDNGAKFSASKQLTPRIDGLSNAITTAQKDNLLCCPETETLMRVCEMVKDKRQGTGRAVLEADKTIRGCYNVGTHDSTISEMVIQHEDNPAFTITTVQQPKMYGATTNYRIRKFTPRECFRLMGVSEHNINLIQASGVSKSQQYKMAGNSIVVDVLFHIFRKMFTETQNEEEIYQCDLFLQNFGTLCPYQFNKENPLRVVTAFSGYDSQCMALDRLQAVSQERFRYGLVAWSETDRFVIQAHNAVYPQYADRNLGDIAKIDWRRVPDFDLFTYSFPCTDISCAGLQKGLSENSGTRSGLLWECRKVIDEKRPRFLLMENVEALVQKKFVSEFRKWQDCLTANGYTNFWRVLNAKDYGVPQNRPRVFMVSILDKNVVYHFPRPFPLKLRIKDIIEQNVDGCYYLKEERLAGLRLSTLKELNNGNGFKFEPKSMDDTANSITSKAGSRKTDNYLQL